MDKENYIYIYTHTHIYTCNTHTHSGILLSHKKKDILSFATTWMTLEDVTRGEINQTQKDKYCVISLICGIRKEGRSLLMHRRLLVLMRERQRTSQRPQNWDH